jgi:hypothetical protein
MKGLTEQEKELHQELNKHAMYIIELTDFLKSRNSSFNPSGLYHMRTDDLAVLHEAIVTNNA